MNEMNIRGFDKQYCKLLLTGHLRDLYSIAIHESGRNSLNYWGITFNIKKNMFFRVFICIVLAYNDIV